MTSPQHVLVTGATGYIGGRLVPELLQQGHKVRCFVRTPQKLSGLSWRDDVEVAKGDLEDADSMASALEGIDTAYYLVHSMSEASGGAFTDRDRKIAASFRDAAAQAGVKRIVYLGGLGDENDPQLSKHLKSRHEVGAILADGPVPVTELRAAVIIGSGSASFEMLRTIVEALPVMVTPRWVRTKCQPIAIRDVLFYLCAVLDAPETTGKVLELGGPEVFSYEKMMRIYGEVAGLKKRLIVHVPFLTATLSSHWIGLVTPLPTALAKPLVGGLSSEVIVRNHEIDKLIPHDNIGYVESLKLAIQRTRDLQVTTSWADADLGWRQPALPLPSDPEWSGGLIQQNVQTYETDASAHDVFKSVCAIGGRRGWLITEFLWDLRGWMDKAVGGVGMRRGRRHPDDLRIGDALDFWRVEELVPDRLLRLRAEMRVPGKAYLEWTISEEDGKTKMKQWARFQPRGLTGRLYWWVCLPFHAVIFKNLGQRLIDRAGTTY